MKNFLAGLGVGAALGLMLAPEAGSEIRGKLHQRLGSVRKVMDRLRQSIHRPNRQSSSTDGQGTLAVATESGSQSETLLEILNTGSKTKLMSVRGIGEATARRIIDGRPYNSADDLLEAGILSAELLKKAEKDLIDEVA